MCVWRNHSNVISKGRERKFEEENSSISYTSVSEVEFEAESGEVYGVTGREGDGEEYW